MPIAGSSIRHGPWVGGVRYDLPVEEQATNTLYEMSNTKVGLSGEVRKRLGYAKYIATALSSTTITAVGYAPYQRRQWADQVGGLGGRLRGARCRQPVQYGRPHRIL